MGRDRGRLCEAGEALRGCSDGREVPLPSSPPSQGVREGLRKSVVPRPLHLRAPSWPCSRGAWLSRERGQATWMEPRDLVGEEVRVGFRLGWRWRLEVDAGLRAGGGGLRGPQLVTAPHRPAAFLVPVTQPHAGCQLTPAQAQRLAGSFHFLWLAWLLTHYPST